MEIDKMSKELENRIEELENIVNASCTCADWCLMDQLPEHACCMGSECECKLRDSEK